jgi:hypothetical protein
MDNAESLHSNQHKLTDLKSFARSQNGDITQISTPKNLPIPALDILSKKFRIEPYREADFYIAEIQNVWPLFDRYFTDGNVLIHGGLNYNEYTINLPGVDPGGTGAGAEYFQGKRDIQELISSSPRPNDSHPHGFWIHGGSGPAFFGHWLWEHLTKFVLLDTLGRLHEAPCFVTNALPKRFLDWLELLFDKRPTISFVDPVKSPTLFQSVEIISTPIYRSRHGGDLCVAEDTLRRLRELGRQRAGATSIVDATPRNKPRALWIERNSPWRNLLNSAEIIDITRQYFDVDFIAMEKLTPKEQILAIQPYDLLIGPSGSSMPISVFASPHSVVLEFFNPRNTGRLAAKLFCDFFKIPHVRVDGTIVGNQNGPTHTDFDYVVDTAGYPQVIEAVSEYAKTNVRRRANHDFFS